MSYYRRLRSNPTMQSFTAGVRFGVTYGCIIGGIQVGVALVTRNKH